MMRIFKKIEVSSKYHSLIKENLDVKYFQNRIYIDALKYSINIDFESIKRIDYKGLESVAVLTHDDNVLSDIYFTNMDQDDCVLLIFSFNQYKSGS